MKQKNKFDLVMDYIDVNVQKEVHTIKKGIYDLIGYNSNSFGQCFSVLTNETLFHYINARRMYFAGMELYELPDKPICDIALEYGYSEQSAFNRAMKAYCGCTPNDVRKGNVKIPNDKYTLTEICNDESETRTKSILKKIRNNEDLTCCNFELFIGLEEASDEYGFDIDVCYQIADIAEKLEVSPLSLIDKCFELIVEEEREWKLSQSEMIIDELEINSFEELRAICEYYDCKYYDLDHFMVEAYRNQTNEEMC